MESSPHVYTTKNLFEKIKTELLPLKTEINGKSVLDIPSGAGALSKFLSEELGAQVIPAEIDLSKWSYAPLKPVYVDLAEKIPFNTATFDYVICLEGIKHVANVSKAISEISRVLKPGATLVITIPNDLNMQTRLKYFFDAQVDCDWGAIGLEDQNVKQHLYLGSIVQLPLLYHFLEKNNLKLIKTETSRLRFWSIVLSSLFYPFIYLKTVRHYPTGHPLRKELVSLKWLAGRHNILFCVKN